MAQLGGSKPSLEGGQPTGDTRRVLVVAAAPVAGNETVDRIRSLLGDNSDAELLVVAPALTESAFEHVMGSVDDAIDEAKQRLRTSVEALRSNGREPQGMVGDSDPLLAIEDALRQFGADVIVIVTEAGEDSHWLEDDLFERAKQRFEPEIVHLATERRADERGVVDVERDGPGAEPPPEAEVEGPSKNMPRFSLRDLLGIAVAGIGTLAAVLIALSCDEGHTLQRTTAEGGEGTSGSCVAAYVIAGATALINVAHVVGLMLFQSVGYRGGWARFFSVMSLIGTPLAVIAVILLV
jgi:hypothetical protein